MTLSTRSEEGEDRKPLLGRPSPPQYSPPTLTTPYLPIRQTTQPPRPVKKIGAPQKHRHIDVYRFFKRANPAYPHDVKSFHFIEKAERKGVNFYYKNNAPGSIMSEVEACNWGYYHVLVPDMVPAKVNVHYNDEGEIIGLSTQELPGFKPAAGDDILTDADLNDPKIIRGVARGLVASWIFSEDDCHRFNISKDGKRVDFDNSNYPITGQLKPRSMLNPTTILDRASRPYDEKVFEVDKDDIDHFPELKKAQPYYWVTKPEPVIIEHTRTFLGWTGIPISKNSFTVVENPTYKKLQNNELFIYYKFTTMLKHILTPDKNLLHVAEQHIGAEREVTNDNLETRKVSDMMSSYVIKRKNEIRETLVRMPSFCDFMKKYGDKALAEIQAEFQEQNQKLRESEYLKFLKSGKTRSAQFELKSKVSPALVQTAYNEVFDATRKHLCSRNVDAVAATQKRK